MYDLIWRKNRRRSHKEHWHQKLWSALYRFGRKTQVSRGCKSSVSPQRNLFVFRLLLAEGIIHCSSHLVLFILLFNSIFTIQIIIFYYFPMYKNLIHFPITFSVYHPLDGAFRWTLGNYGLVSYERESVLPTQGQSVMTWGHSFNFQASKFLIFGSNQTNWLNLNSAYKSIRCSAGVTSSVSVALKFKSVFRITYIPRSSRLEPSMIQSKLLLWYQN